MTYLDLCQPKWIETKPEIFYGFWGACMNSYRDAKPHEGYLILQKWKKQFFGETSPMYKEIKSKMQTHEKDHENDDDLEASFKKLKISESESDPQAVEDEKRHEEVAGPFWCYTSNVDAHFWRYFSRKEVKEIHGNVVS